MFDRRSVFAAYIPFQRIAAVGLCAHDMISRAACRRPTTLQNRVALLAADAIFTNMATALMTVAVVVMMVVMMIFFLLVVGSTLLRAVRNARTHQSYSAL